ncbi:methionyl-tRNA formyltransferase [Paenibacillus oryzisoli]|uniref:phosphoribosylglycinamide formyltransferase 1 n=2 Tax=Paenibacillus oryzisoli TaxID=1850517 RepID=A0A198A066_9BACL|nr:methionyl-tRNA formyltransferase [Paenibacillus oryzisoli]
MKVVLFTGSHPRHLFVAETLLRHGFLSGVVLEKREDFMPTPSSGLMEIDRMNFIRHFADRDAAETRYFGHSRQLAMEPDAMLHVDYHTLNSNEVKDWVSAIRPDVVLTYGVHKISTELLESFPEHRWNIHGGLSPWYRGNTTLFWPFYFMKPNWAGMTIHQLTAKLDGGAIVHHSVPELVRGDGLHDVACRAVKQAAEDIVMILRKLDRGESVQLLPQKSSGKLFMTEDWHPQHLRVVYNLFDNDIVDRFLDGEFGFHEPPLIKAF